MNYLRPFALAVTAWPLCANDTLVTLGAGGLVPLRSGEIAMESEDLQVSIGQITVRYVFDRRFGSRYFGPPGAQSGRF
jgi:hypothetical protein